MITARAASLLALSITAAACSSLTSSAIHDPLYRGQAHTSNITATARDAEGGVAEIRIDAIEGELTACTENQTLPSLIPCRRNAVQRVRVCGFANVKTTVTCTLSMALGDRRLITYTATSRSGSGRTSTTRAITYAAGAPLTQATVTVLGYNFTTPWETARPVWWHTDTPSGGGAADHVDVGFYPDADFGTDYLAFTNALQTIAMGSFFSTTNTFSQNYTVFRANYNLWAGPFGADGEGCSRSFTGAASNVAGVTEGDAILHQNAFRDCASISLGGGGTTEVGLGDAAWVFTHESGHFLHGLGDEYVGGGNASVSDPDNIYGSQSACQTAATTLSISTSFCAQIGMTGTWRMDDGNNTTMEDRALTSDWRTATGLALSRRMSKCSSGSCY